MGSITPSLIRTVGRTGNKSAAYSKRKAMYFLSYYWLFKLASFNLTEFIFSHGKQLIWNFKNAAASFWFDTFQIFIMCETFEVKQSIETLYHWFRHSEFGLICIPCNWISWLKWVFYHKQKFYSIRATSLIFPGFFLCFSSIRFPSVCERTYCILGTG